MTSTNVFKGLNDGRNSSKVLKPPGGGSSDIFGAGEAQAQRRVKNHLASNVFLSDEPAPATPSRTPSGNSHSRLFGPSSPPKSTPRSNRSVSRILPLDGEPTQNGNATPTKMSPVKTEEPQTLLDYIFTPVEQAKGLSSNSSAVNGDMNGDKVDSPATPNGNSSPVTNGNGPMTNGGSAPAPAAPRQRVPPGGFSSGLW